MSGESCFTGVGFLFGTNYSAVDASWLKPTDSFADHKLIFATIFIFLSSKGSSSEALFLTTLTCCCRVIISKGIGSTPFQLAVFHWQTLVHALSFILKQTAILILNRKPPRWEHNSLCLNQVMDSIL